MTIVYKATCSRREGQRIYYISAVHSHHPHLTLVYHIGLWTKPKIKDTAIFTFDTLKNCENWIKKNDFRFGESILMCEARVSTKSVKFVSTSNVISEHVYQLLTQEGRKKELESDLPPFGTVYCEKVKPIELVRTC